ncbi:flagellar export protein FliJ [Natroniella sulfidigena]|uniref:flagellar export protein FliJ n=1 Tax=Natroniella sulfidigena TaxID=723921 RepID=UPI00200AE441|nr:flagellar export protein FliJ [Natroniella sulfidigena]MCK8816530.1 flagellar export protein FliJ [Natroniella sulfidigena]
MKKFSFGLQSVLNLKEQEETLVQKELAKLQHKYNQVKNNLDRYKTKKQNCQQQLESSEVQEVDLSSALRSRNYIKYLTEEIEELWLQLEYWEDKIKQCRVRLLEKVKEKKTLAKLKEQQYEEHFEEVLQEEQKINDELAINLFNHQGNKGSIF